VHVLVAGSEELDCEEEGLGFGKAAVAVAEHVHEGTAGAEFEGQSSSWFSGVRSWH
jgi:hypothetical protein